MSMTDFRPVFLATADADSAIKAPIRVGTMGPILLADLQTIDSV